jgi:hypothetical protein
LIEDKSRDLFAWLAWFAVSDWDETGLPALRFEQKLQSKLAGIRGAPAI